jgi:hypothetical protein
MRAPSNVHFQQGSIPFRWAQPCHTLCSGAEFSPRMVPSAFCHGALHPYVKLGMRPARGSNAGATEVPRIGQVRSSENEHASPPLSPDGHFVDWAANDSFPAFPHSPYTIHHTGLIPFHTTPDRGAQPLFEMDTFSQPLAPQVPPQMKAEITCHKTSVHVIPAPIQRVIGCTSGQHVQVGLRTHPSGQRIPRCSLIFVFFIPGGVPRHDPFCIMTGYYEKGLSSEIMSTPFT